MVKGMYRNALIIFNGGDGTILFMDRVVILFTSNQKHLTVHGKHHATAKMNDYIDIGIFGLPAKTKDGRQLSRPLYVRQLKLTAGEHTFTFTVKGKPSSAAIDPYAMLIDRQPNDNAKNL